MKPSALQQELPTQRGERFFLIHMKLKCCASASETHEMWVQLTVRSGTFLASGASQTSRAPRALGSHFGWLRAAGLPAALLSKEPGSGGVTHPFRVIFFFFFLPPYSPWWQPRHPHTSRGWDYTTPPLNLCVADSHPDVLMQQKKQLRNPSTPVFHFAFHSQLRLWKLIDSETALAN